MRVNTFTAMRQLVRAGAGLAIMPCCWPDDDLDLVRLTPPLDGHAVPLWVLTHPDVRHSARVKTLARFLSDGLGSDHTLRGSDGG